MRTQKRKNHLSPKSPETGNTDLTGSLKAGIPMIRIGLCCVFKQQPITFKRKTAKYLSRFSREEQLGQLSGVCLHNARSLLAALAFAAANTIGSFRINSQILPLKTHSECGYDITDLPDHQRIVDTFRQCGAFCRQHHIRTTFHPDQFILLSSPDPGIVERSVMDLEYQAEVSEWVNADVINIHGGGAYGDKPSALKRLAARINLLPTPVRSRLTLENDDRTYTPDDLLPVCRDTGIPLVYDVHHHRCNPDGAGIEQTTRAVIKTWNRDPLFHLSSPLNGWQSKNTGPHHDYIDPADFPKYWLKLGKDTDFTVEIEAKAKELAIAKLIKDLRVKF